MLIRNEFMKGLNEQIFFPEEYSDEAKLFFLAYEIESFRVCPAEKMKGLKPKPQRVCRFCGKAYGEVRFKRDAHVLSELLGNRYLVSDFECDSCNAIFGKYEDQLSKYLGMSRTAMLVEGKEKMPTYKPVGNGFRMEGELYPGGTGGVTVSREQSNGTFRYNDKTGLFEIVGKKHHYIPYAVYKALVKMGLSCLDDNQAAEYPLALDFVTGRALQEEGRPFAHIVKYTFPYTYGSPTPMVFVFRKRFADTPFYSHVVLLFALNAIYEYAIPFNTFDLQVPGGELSLCHCPPLFSRPYRFPTTAIVKERVELSSDEAVRDQEDVLPIDVQPGQKIRGLVQDPETGEITDREFSIDDVASVHVSKVRLDEPGT